MTQWEMINVEIGAREDDLIALRRTLHAQPELSRQEFETTRRIAERLAGLGFEVHVRDEGLGLYADLTPPGFDPAVHRTVAVRSDLDALPIVEGTGLPYTSQNQGVMHACGHDMHMAIVMGVAHGLVAQRGSLPGRLRLIYQHAEEVAPGGAEDMIAFGAMEGVDAILGVHVDPERPMGRVGIKDGPLTAASDAFDLVIHGTGGHTARPHQTVDPLFLGVQVANALYTFVGRALDARDAVVLGLGIINAGHVHNAIPASCHLGGTVRSLSPENRAAIDPKMRALIEGVLASWGATYELSWRLGAPAVINVPRINVAIAEAATALIGADHIDVIPLPSMGAEDFSHFLAHAPGAMFRLGTARADEPQHLLHTPLFNPDERAITLGARILARAAVALMSP